MKMHPNAHIIPIVAEQLTNTVIDHGVWTVWEWDHQQVKILVDREAALAGMPHLQPGETIQTISVGALPQASLSLSVPVEITLVDDLPEGVLAHIEAAHSSGTPIVCRVYDGAADLSDCYDRQTDAVADYHDRIRAAQT